VCGSLAEELERLEAVTFYAMPVIAVAGKWIVLSNVVEFNIWRVRSFPIVHSF